MDGAWLSMTVLILFISLFRFRHLFSFSRYCFYLSRAPPVWNVSDPVPSPSPGLGLGPVLINEQILAS